jgi:hypothetical protein
MKVPELKTGQMITLAFIIGIVVVLYIVYKILGAVGLVKTPAKKRAEAETKAAISMIRTDEYFDPMYVKTHNLIGQYKSIGANAGVKYSQDIHDSIYGFLKIGTNAEEIFSTFGKLYNKVNVSEVALNYLVQYNRDMRADLLNNLSDQHITDLMNIINGLPNK